MSELYLLNHRRMFLQGMALSTAFYAIPGAFAQELAKTPRQTEGPFYPDKLPLDTDNDLLILNNSLTPGVGEITHLTGRVLDPTGAPVRNAIVEIWQCDNNGAYLHSGTGNKEKQDKNFQGFGRFLTNSKGEYYFRTIKPVKYPGRAPHIHYIIEKGDKRMLTTQLYVKGDPGNEKDGIWKNIRDQRQRENVTVDFKPITDSKIGELSAHFEIVLGMTPEEVSTDRGRGTARKR